MGIGFRVKDRALGVESFESLEGSEIGFKVPGCRAQGFVLRSQGKGLV